MAKPLTIISDEISQDLSAVAAFVRDFGLGGIELRSMFGRAFKDLTAADIEAIRSAFVEEGRAIQGCATPVFKCALHDAAAIREHGEIFRRSLDKARSLNCTLLRVFTFLRQPAGLDESTARRVADQLRPLCELAAQAGVRVGIENETSCLVAAPAGLALLGKFLALPTAGVIWDPCNVVYLPGFESEDLAAAYRRLAPQIIHIHVKDAMRASAGGAGARAAPVGQGQVGWAEQLAAIRQSGYTGLISLETHWRKTALDDHLLHLPAGYAFSAGGDEASRICFPLLQKLWSASGASA